MSAPIIWIVIPGILAVILFLTNRWQRLNTIIALITSVLLSLLAIFLPIGNEFNVAALTYQIRESQIILGRQLIITSSDIPILVIIYLGMAIWIAGAYFTNVSKLFPSIAIGTAVLLVSAMSVQPFLYAAVLIELAALACVPLVTSPGEKVGSGVLRFITSYTIGMPAILFVGWILTASTSTVLIENFQLQAGIFLVIGFMFILAIFPVHSWVPMLIEQTQPFAATFAIFWLTQAGLFFGFGLLGRYELAPDVQTLSNILRIIGVFIVVINAVFIMFQKDLGRLLGFFILGEVGFTILTMSLQPPVNGYLFYSLSLLKMLPIVLCAFCLSHLHLKYTSLNFRRLTGLFQSNHWVATGVITSILCLMGMPLLPMFPIKYQIIAELGNGSIIFSLSLWLVFFLLIISLVRVIYVFFTNRDDETIFESENLSIKLPIWIGIIMLLIGGIASEFFINVLLGVNY